MHSPGCGYKFIKYLLFAFNFIFWLAGAAVLGLSIWILANGEITQGLDLDIFGTRIVVIILAAAGGLMLVVGFFGCCGAINESKCLLGLYFASLFVIFGLEVGVAVWAFVEFNSLQGIIDEALRKTTDDSAIDFNESYQKFQQEFECCGTTSICEGFSSNVYQNCSCETSGVGACGVATDLGSCPNSTTPIYTTSCNDAVYNWIYDNLVLLAGIALGIGLTEILGMMVACCLYCRISEDDAF